MKIASSKVLLTGATGGIGRAVAKRLAREQAELVLVGRKAAELRAMSDELQRAGAIVDSIIANIATADGRAIVHRYADAIGGISVLINCAGVNDLCLFSEHDERDIERIIAVNTTAPMLLTRRLLPSLLGQPQAAIVNVGSILGSIAMPGQAAYAASKFALHGFTEALRRELSDSSVKVVYVAPRTTDTRMNSPVAVEVNRRAGVSVDSPDAVAAVIVESLCKGRAERFIGWPERLFVKLNALLPSLVDRAMRKQLQLVNQDLAPDENPAPTFGVNK